MAVASLALLGFLALSLIERPVTSNGGVAPDKPALLVYCAASNKHVMEAIRQDYEAEYGTAVQVQYGGSQSLLASLKLTHTGDLFLPADDSFIRFAEEQQLVSDEFPLAKMQAVVAVRAGNPKGIKTLSDLWRPDVRVALGNTEATAIGQLTQAALTELNCWEVLKQHTIVFKTTVNEVANDIAIGAVDAGIVYDVSMHDYETLESVSIAELATIQAHVAVAVLKSSSQPQQALHFARYLCAPDKGQVRYREFGFQVVNPLNEGLPTHE